MSGTNRYSFGEELPQLPVAPPGPATRSLSQRLRQVESRNVTYLARDFPVFWREARGANVRDADGNVYLDLTGAFGVALAGHAHPEVTAAIRKQAGMLPHAMGDVHPAEVKVELLERLAGLSPWGEARSVLAGSGSEAVEIALKTALLATERPGIVAFEGGYHGLTVGALAATAREAFRDPFRARLYTGVRFAPFPDSYREGAEQGTRRALRALEEALAEGEERGAPVGAVIVEPIQGRAGVRVPPPGFLEGVARRARAAGALFILDEVFTGFGRTGDLFAFKAEGVVPDLLCLGKALGGGLPLSACVGPGPLMDAWPESEGEALHTSTFLGHPVACAAALAFLDVLEEEGLVDRAREMGRKLRDRLEEGLSGVRHVGEVRGRGLLLGIELVAGEGEGASPGGRTDGKGLPSGWEGGGARVAAAALHEGLLILPAGERGEVVELAPPACMTRRQLEWAADTLIRVIRETPPG